MMYPPSEGTDLAAWVEAAKNKTSNYPQPFHCLDCELGWTDTPSCWSCGKVGTSGVLTTSRLMNDSVASMSPRVQTYYSTTARRDVPNTYSALTDFEGEFITPT